MTSVRQRSYLILFSAVCFSLIIVLAAGCFRSPNVRKQKFVEQGDAYFKDGKYPEAQISYARALQIDPRFVTALYKSAQCSMRLGHWTSAFQELSRTVALDPQNYPAQLDLGTIYLGAGKLQDAKDRALTVLEKDAKDVNAKMLLSSVEGALGNQKDALDIAREALTISPNNSAVYINLAGLQQKYGALSEAEV